MCWDKRKNFNKIIIFLRQRSWCDNMIIKYLSYYHHNQGRMLLIFKWTVFRKKMKSISYERKKFNFQITGINTLWINDMLLHSIWFVRKESTPNIQRTEMLDNRSFINFIWKKYDNNILYGLRINLHQTINKILGPNSFILLIFG